MHVREVFFEDGRQQSPELVARMGVIPAGGQSEAAPGKLPRIKRRVCLLTAGGKPYSRSEDMARTKVKALK